MAKAKDPPLKHPLARFAGAKPRATDISYGDLRRICLEAVKQWPGCETVSAIQIIRRANRRFAVRVALYGNSDRRVADRAMRCVEREMGRHYLLLE